MAVEAEALESQLLSQMLDAVRVTPMLHEDLQVEVMKVSPLCTLGLLKRSDDLVSVIAGLNID